MYNRGDFAAPAAAARQQHREPAGPQGSKLGGCETSRHQLELSGKKQTNSQLAMSIKRSWRGELLSLFGPTFRYQQTRKTIFTTIFRSCSNQKPMGFSPHHRTRSLRSVASKTAVFGPPGSDGSGVAVAFAEATVALAGSCGAATGMVERHRAWDEAVEAAPFPICQNACIIPYLYYIYNI